MSRKLLTLTLLAALAAFSFQPTIQAAHDGIPDDAELETIERGAYLVTIMSCNDCHTPFHMTENGPAPDMSRMMSGHPQEMELPPAPAADGPWLTAVAATNTAWAGPWGVSFTANVTPDVETGIGAWSEEDFISALRTGRHKGRGREILPPMPWPFIGQATDEDLSAIFAFLQQIPAISNRVPDPIPPVTSH